MKGGKAIQSRKKKGKERKGKRVLFFLPKSREFKGEEEKNLLSGEILRER